MTSSEIRASFLDFFREKQPHHRPLQPAPPRRAQPPLHQRRHEPVHAHLPRPGHRALQPPAPPTPKSASAPAASTTTSRTSASTPTTTPFSKCSATGPSATTSRRKPSHGPGNLSSALEVPPPRIYVTVYKPSDGDPRELDQEASDNWAGIFTAAGLDPTSTSSTATEGQFLDDGRHRSVRTLLRNPYRLHARRRRPPCQPGDPRVMEIWNLVFIQFNANPDGTLTAAPRQARRYRHGFRAHRLHLARHKGLHRFAKRPFPITIPTFSIPSSTNSRNSPARPTTPRCPTSAQNLPSRKR